MLTVAYMGGGGCQKWPKMCLCNLRMAPKFEVQKLGTQGCQKWPKTCLRDLRMAP